MESDGELRYLGKTRVAPQVLWKGKNKILEFSCGNTEKNLSTLNLNLLSGNLEVR